MAVALSSRGTSLLKRALGLPPGERAAFFDALQSKLRPKRLGVLSDLPAIRKSKFAERLACPHCDGVEVVRNGTYAGRQRYLCQGNSCGRSFNDFTGTPFHGAHHPDKWEKFLDLMLEGVSLRKIAAKLSIHVSTAFYWRHKVLRSVDEAAQAELGGVVESDETYVLDSRKGQKGFTDRPARERGGVATRRGISREQVCLFVAADRHGRVFSTVAGFGRLTTKEIKGLLEPHAKRITVLCTDEEAQFKAAARGLNLVHQRLNSKRGSRVKYGVYHIQNVNAYHQRLKKWAARFNGVSTRWLNNYLAWHRALESMRGTEDGDARKRFLLVICSVTRRTPVSTLRPDKKAPSQPAA